MFYTNWGHDQCYNQQIVALIQSADCSADSNKSYYWLLRMKCLYMTQDILLLSDFDGLFN